MGEESLVLNIQSRVDFGDSGFRDYGDSVLIGNTVTVH